MSKIYNYTIIITTILIIMNVFLPGSTASSQLLNFVGNGDFSNLTSSPAVIAILAIFASALVTGLAIGFITRSSAESTIIATLAASIAGVFAVDMLSIYTYVKDTIGIPWFAKVILIIMFPLFAGFLVSIISWWRGADA